MTDTSVKTASWFTPLPSDHVRIGISRGTPRFSGISGYRLYRKLNPGPWFSSIQDPVAWEQRYRDEVLDRLNPHQVLDDAVRIADGRVPVLCCFERVGSGHWCHRSLAAAWLAKSLRIKVPEIGYEHLSQDKHPLLVDEIRQGKLKLWSRPSGVLD
jgi:hypothetical protein